MSKKRSRSRRRSKRSRNQKRKSNEILNFEALEPRKLLACDVFQPGGDYCFDATGQSIELRQDETTIEIINSINGSVQGLVELGEVGDRIEIQNANTVVIDSALALDGNSLEIEAISRIDISSNIGTTDIDTPNNGNDRENSGSLSFRSAEIIVNAAFLDAAAADGTVLAGDIGLTAEQTRSADDAEFGTVPFLQSNPFRNPMISLTSVTVDGGKIDIRAIGETQTLYGEIGQFTDAIGGELMSVEQLNLNAIEFLSGQANIHRASAEVTLDNTTINGLGHVSILADARTDASLDAIKISGIRNGGEKFLNSVAFGKAHSDAKVNLLGTTSIDAAGEVDIKSYAESIAEVSSQAFGGTRDSVDIDMALNISFAMTDEHSHVVLEADTSVFGNQGVSIEALGKVVNEATANTSLFQPGGGAETDNEAGLSLALGVDNAVIKTDVSGDVSRGEIVWDVAFVEGANVEADNTIIRVPFSADRPLVVGDRIYYRSIQGLEDLGLTEGSYTVTFAEHDGPAGEGKIWQRIRLAQSEAYVELDSRQVPENSTHSLTKLGQVDFNADDESVEVDDNFIHLANLPENVTEVTYLGPDLEAAPDAEGIQGLLQNETYEVVHTDLEDQYQLRSLETGALLAFEVPDGGRHGFYFTQEVQSFRPRSDVDGDKNTIQLDPSSGFRDGDLVFYNTDPQQVIQRALQNKLDEIIGNVDLPDAPVRGLSNEMGYRVIMDPEAPGLIRLTTSVEAVESSRSIRFNPDSVATETHLFLRNPTFVEIRAELDARNTAEAGVALSDKDQPTAEIAFTAAEIDMEAFANSADEFIDHLQLNASGKAGDANGSTDVSANTGTTTEVAGSLALSVFDHDVQTTIRDSASITSSYDVDIAAKITQAVQLNTVSETNRRGTGTRKDPIAKFLLPLPSASTTIKPSQPFPTMPRSPRTARSTSSQPLITRCWRPASRKESIRSSS